MFHTENLILSIKILFILVIRYGLSFNCLFRFLKSLRKCTQIVLGLGCSKDEAPRSELFDLSRNISRAKRSTSFLTFLYVTLVLDMFLNISALHPI